MFKITLALVCISLFFYACDKSKSPTEPADTTPPAEVTNLQATSAVNSVTLTWVDPTDADYDHVEITFIPTVTGITQPVTVAKGTITKKISGLINSVAYTFTVKTVDKSGNKSTGTTRQATPIAPPLSGHWSGVRIDFNVSSDGTKITTTNTVLETGCSMIVTIPADDNILGVTAVTFYIRVDVTISNGSFYFHDSEKTISGTFTSANTCDGSASFSVYESSHHVTLTGSLSWSAVR